MESGEELLMSTHNICLRGEIRKNINIFYVEKPALSGDIVC